MNTSFVPSDFVAPESLAAQGFLLEPLGPQHNERDHEAWMSSLEHIRATPGLDAWAGHWPEPMSLEDNLSDLIRHAEDFEARRGFTYSILDGDEVVGCLYIYPSTEAEYDASVISWVRASRADLDGVVRRTVSDWLSREWPFTNWSYAFGA